MGTTNHEAKVIKIEALEKHPNADSLSIVRIGGYQVIVRTEDWKVGDLGVYIQPDSVVPPEKPYDFLWKDNEYPDGVIPPKKRRITVKKLRKEYSEGLLLPLKDVVAGGRITSRTECDKVGEYPVYVVPYDTIVGTAMEAEIREGDDLADVLGITHYEPPEPAEAGENEDPNKGRRQRKIFPHTLKGWVMLILRYLTFGKYDPRGEGFREAGPEFRPVYDVEARKNYPNAIPEGTIVRITEKIHGANGRYTFENDRMYAGSRNTWKAPKSNCIWRKVLEQNPWIEQYCRLHPGYTLYVEVVPAQKGWTYGCDPGTFRAFPFDILDAEGNWVPDAQQRIELPPELYVPILFVGPFFVERAKVMAESESCFPNTVREGVVIRVADPTFHARGLGRPQLKIVANKFYEAQQKESA
jgi:RNA ligase